MGRKDKKLSKVVISTPPKKEVVKEEVSPKKVVKKEKVVEVIEEKPKKEKIKKEVVVETTPVVEEKIRKDYYGVGLVGDNSAISLFKGLCKMKKLVVGEELLKMLNEFNTKNKI